MRLSMKIRAILTSFIITICGCQNPDKSSSEVDPIRIGLIADCQYADQPSGRIRQYRLSEEKLASSIDTLNRSSLDHVFILGDLIDRNQISFLKVLPMISEINHPVSIVLGNHDFSVADSLKIQVPEMVGLDSTYYAVYMGKWKFIILDGNDVSLYAYPEGSAENEHSKQIFSEQFSGHKEYNGAIGKEQLDWLELELRAAEQNNQNVILLCHFPAWPEDDHSLWNAEEVVATISGFPSVIAWINGHNHAGNYAEKSSIHFITLKGMVDTEENSFSIMEIYNDSMVINGFGRELDTTLLI